MPDVVRFLLVCAAALFIQARASDARADDFGCRAAILLYHYVHPHADGEPQRIRNLTVSTDAFARQIQYLDDHQYAVVPFRSVADCLVRGIPLPKRAVVLTFDDGLLDQYVNALPVLERHRMTATFFIVTKAVGGKGVMNWHQVEDLASRGMTIGAHTKTHPVLTRISDPEQLRDEIEGSKAILEARLHAPVLFFAYPHGLVDARVIEAVRAAGFVAARGIKPGVRERYDDRFSLKIAYAFEDIGAFAEQLRTLQ